MKLIGCYFENWNEKAPFHPGPGTPSNASYWAPVFKDCTHVFYSAIILHQDPNKTKDSGYWDGTGLIDSATGTDIIDEMTKSTSVD